MEAEREEADVHTLLRALDDPPPRTSPEGVAARAGAVAVGVRAHDSAWLRRAASILLAVGIAGVAYAVPGSPVRGWVRVLVRKVGGRSEPSTMPPYPKDSHAGVSGIALLPGQKFLILLKSAQGGGQALVSLTDGPEVQVRAPAGAATFTSSADQLLIDNRDSLATFEIRIPRDAPWVEIQVGGARVFLKEGPRVTTTGFTSAAGGYVLRLTPSGP